MRNIQFNSVNEVEKELFFPLLVKQSVQFLEYDSFLSHWLSFDYYQILIIRWIMKFFFITLQSFSALLGHLFGSRKRRVGFRRRSVREISFPLQISRNVNKMDSATGRVWRRGSRQRASIKHFVSNAVAHNIIIICDNYPWL